MGYKKSLYKIRNSAKIQASVYPHPQQYSFLLKTSGGNGEVLHKLIKKQ